MSETRSNRKPYLYSEYTGSAFLIVYKCGYVSECIFTHTQIYMEAATYICVCV